MSDKEKKEQDEKSKVDDKQETKVEELSDDDLDNVAGGKKIKISSRNLWNAITVSRAQSALLQSDGWSLLEIFKPLSAHSSRYQPILLRGR